MPDIDIVARLKLAGEEFSAKFKGQMDAVENQARSASSRVSNALSGLRGVATGLVTGATVAAIAAAAQRGLEYASSLGEVSQQLGVTTKDLQIYRFVATQTGVDQAAMDTSLAKLTQTIGKAALGAKAPSAAFKTLGIDIRDANGAVKTAGEAIPEIADALAKIPSPAKRAALEVTLFSRAGQQLEPALAGGSAAIKEFAAQAERFGLVLDKRLIDQADEAADKVSFLKQVLEVKIAGAVAENAGAILQLADAMIRVASAAGGAITAVKNFNNLQVIRSNVASAETKEAARKQLLADPAGRAAFAANIKERRTSEQAAFDGDLFKTSADRARHIENLKGIITEATQVAAAEKAARAAASAPGRKPKVADPDEIERATSSTKRLAGATKEAADAAIKLTPFTAHFEGIRLSADAAGDKIRDFYNSIGVTPDLSEFREQVERVQEVKSDAAERAYEEERDRQSDLDRQREDAVRDVTGLYADLMEGGNGSIWKSFRREGKEAIAEIAARYTLALLSGQKTSFASILGSAAGTGSPLDRLSSFTNLLGGGSTLAGGSAGAASPVLTTSFGTSSAIADLGTSASRIGSVAGAGGSLGGLAGIGSALSSAAGPFALAVAGNQLLGDVLGFKGGPLGIFTSTFDKLIGGSKSGVASISSIDGTAALGGTSGKSKTAASSLAGSIQESLKLVADRLDAQLGSFAVSIGIRDGDYRVDPTGRGNLKVKKGVLDFGDDQEGAVRAAIANALADGAIKGISDAEQRILQSGQDLDAALEKVRSLRSITTDLQQRLDPTGYAIDQVNKKFADLVAILDETGASADKRAEAEQLYRLELADAEKASGGAREALQAFLDSFKVGSSSPFSLRDQESAARAALQPFLDKIGAGTSVDQDAYLKAAQSFLDVERQLYGSTDAYFQALDKVQAATNAAIATIDKTAPIRGTTVDPFAEKTASNTRATAEISAETRDLLVEQNGLLRAMLAGTGSASTFASGLEPRLFAA